ncbi:uncharacterized protein PG998_003266 [Apiospora kogelbergensis]|uniref:uncharacterized protein n=1 Tax=Apiospora kogelbergensis TaxID=1337665 RepID=UPI003130BA3A
MNATAAVGCALAAEGRFGPLVQGCRDNFDFTLSFEQYIFTILPASALLIAAPLRIFHLRRLPAVVGGVALLSLSALHLTCCIVWAIWYPTGSPVRSAATAAASISFIATLFACVLSYSEHARSVKPSSTLNAYLLVSLILDVATLRTTWLSQLPVSIRAVSTISFGLKAGILVLEAIEKRRYILDKGCLHSPEETSGIYSQGLFLWLNSLLRNGYRQLLKPTDLFPVEEGMSAAVLDDKFWKIWHSSSASCKHRLPKACFRALQMPIAMTILPRTALIAFNLCQPLLLSRFLTHLQSTSESVNIGYGLVSAYGLVYTGMAISSAFYCNRASRMTTMLRGMLVSAVYRKTIESSITSMDESAPVTLMSTDVEAIVRAARFIHDIWADIIQIAIATWLLSVQIGPAAAAPIMACVIALGLTFYMSPKSQGAMGAWNKMVQRRVGITSKMLGHMKGVKMSGLAKGLEVSINQLRADEIKAAAPFRLVSSLSSTIAQIPILLAPVATFAFFAIVALHMPARNASPQRDASNINDIQLQNSSFGWTDDSRFVLENVSFIVKKDQFVLLTGPVASGKTTLLKGILGEVPFTLGTVKLRHHKLSWCDQTPWLTNGTIRKNILGFSPYNAELYDQVVYACDLQKDFEQLPDGDESLVGSKGISLSGGQKQRVIALFDDIFSGLDDHTANSVCKRLFGNDGGLLRGWGTTIILATQSACALPVSDLIITIGQKGTIEEMGTLQEVSTRPVFAKLFPPSEKHIINDHAASKESASSAGDNQLPKRSPDDDKPTDKRRQLGDHAAYGFYLSSLGDVWLKWWADASATDGNHDIGLYLGVYAAFQVAAIIFFFVTTWFVLLKVIHKSGLEMHRRLLHAVVRAPLSLFTAEDTGSITTKSVFDGLQSQQQWLISHRFSQDLGQLDHNLPMGMLVTINSFLVCTAQAVLIASATWYIAISFPILIGVIYCLQKVFLRTSRQLRILDLEEKAPIYTQFIETLAGLTTIRAFAWERPSTELNHDLVDRSQKPFYLLLMVQQWLTLVLDLIVASLALLVAGLAVRLRDTVSIGFIGVSLVQLITFAETVKMLIKWWTLLETSIGAVARIKQFTEESQDENLPGENQPIPESWPAHGSMEICNISAFYGKGVRMNKALDDVTISVKAGEKVGIVGRTGSGKSSLLLTMVRMLDISAGSIKVDGLDLATLSREAVRSRLIMITQDQFFLPGTMRQNIDPYESSTVAEIVAVLEKVGLWDAIQEKGGLDAAFQEETLSHGQGQLFFLARAILRKDCGKLVLLDEATSSVDRTTEARVQELIRTEFRDHTVIAIAHRLETIADFDRVVVLEKGYVVEQGKPDELLRARGPFTQLWNTQRYSLGSPTEQPKPDRRIPRQPAPPKRTQRPSPIRQIFQIPDTPAPPPRRPQRRDPNGRRVPRGPPPPRSWLALSQSRHAPSAHQHPEASHIRNWPLPGAYYPEDGSLVDVTLRHMATDWIIQKDWNKFYLYTLSGVMRSALLYYVSTLHERGLSAADIRLVLGGPSESELAEYELEKPDLNKLNKDIFHLDLTGSIGNGLSLKSLTDLLFISQRQQQAEVQVQDSWDAPELISQPTKLLPNLTHLSLAMSPSSTRSASWRQLLILASKLPTLTHLNLSGWPAPSLTPNAMAAKVVSPVTGRSANYGATNHYSHILDDDWSEAVLILRKLSKSLYSLVYLDLTGCGDWFPALRKEAEGENSTSSVDWASDWGKIEVLRLCSGYAADPDSTAHLSRLWDWKRQAVVVEKNIRSQRAGRGRFITVEMDKLPDLVERPAAVNAGLAHNI